MPKPKRAKPLKPRTPLEARRERAPIAAFLDIKDWNAARGNGRKARFPHLPTISTVLRSGKDVPEEVRLFLADIIDSGWVKHPGKGRPTTKSKLEEDIDDGFARLIFEKELHSIKALDKKDRIEEFGVGTPYELALEAAQRRLESIKYHVSIDAIRKVVGKKRAKKHPWER